MTFAELVKQSGPWIDRGLKAIGLKRIGKRSYREVASVGGINSDWALSAIGEDSAVWQSIFLLRERSRDLFRTDCYFAKYVEELWANVFGEQGTVLRMRVKEMEDRVVYAAAEKQYLRAWQDRRERLIDWMEQETGRKIDRTKFRRINPVGNNGERQAATVKIGELDLFANMLIEKAWKEWQRKEFCTVTGKKHYREVRQMRLLSAARDGDFFIRHVRDPKINKFGYSLQLINSEWCDFSLNTILPNGNEIRMGVELDQWKKPVAYYFIKPQPMSWQYATPGAFSYAAPSMHDRVSADEILHYIRFKDADSTRAAPWSAPVIPKSRHLDKYEEAEVVAARVAACKLGFFYSDLLPEGGEAQADLPDPTKSPQIDAEPASFEGLKWGVKFQEWNPNHPNGNFDLFRKGVLRAWCAGMPGANYNIIANDLEGVNYSSGRLGSLDERELWRMLQRFDIDTAERPIFEAWLEMALMTGAIALPYSKFDKFNKPHFQGRGWAWVDPLKEVQANALEIANKFTSRTQIHDENGTDFTEILFQLAEEKMAIEELGMDATPVVGKTSPTQPAVEAPDISEMPPEPIPKPSARSRMTIK